MIEHEPYFEDRELTELFSSHVINGAQERLMKEVREGALSLARTINRGPDTPEKVKAIEALQEAVWWANGGIARHP